MACPHPRPFSLAREKKAFVGLWVVACAAVLLLLAIVLGAAPAVGQGATNRAGLVVRHGDGRVTYAYVPFAEDEISGIELLRRSGVPLVTLPFGGLGEGVCSLEGEGCGVDECRRRVCQGPRPDDPYWRYFRQKAPGDWQPLALGGSATKVRDGDVDAWSWTGGEAGLPALSLADVARAAGGSEDGTEAAGPVRRTVFPPGAAPPEPDPGQGWAAYAGAGAVLVAIGGGALVAARRRRPSSEAA